MTAMRFILLLALSMLIGSTLASEPRAVTGSLTYRARIALAPNAFWVVEARGAQGEQLGEARQPSAGQQVPLAFALNIPQRVSAEVRAALFVGGQARWVSAPVAIAPGVEPVDLGELVLEPYTPLGFASQVRCGDTRLRLGIAGDQALLETATGAVALTQVAAASGVKLQSADGRTWVWTKGDAVQVAVDGESLQDCAQVPPDAEPEWDARGHEPAWSLRVMGGQATLTTLVDPNPRTGRLAAPRIAEGAFIYQIPELALALRLVAQPCRDIAIGRPHPYQVRLEQADQRLDGCGGDPLQLLRGPEWVVEDVANRGIIDSARLTLQIGRDGAVSGSGGCNRYHGSLRMTGETFALGPLASTMMACPAALMDQERRFHEALARVDGFDIDDTGALRLLAGRETLILARR